MSRKKQSPVESPAAKLLSELQKLPGNRIPKRDKLSQAWRLLMEARQYEDYPILADYGMEHGLFRSCEDLQGTRRDGQRMGTVVWTNPIDNSEMIWIPAGPFSVSSLPNYRKATCEGFSMARTPVTNAQFQKFLDETGYEPSQDPRFRPETFLAHWTKKGTIPRGKENHPVTWVSFIDAVNYCEWAGMTLPTEWLWQKAARGPKGYTFPWGDTAPTKKLANYQSKGTTPVEQFAHIRTPYGCIDMIGNVSEWCQLVGHDYSKMPIELPSVEVTEGDLVGDLDNQRIVKGGCYLRTSNETLTVWHRRYLAITRRNHWVGFRPAVFGPWCAGEL